MHRKALSSTVYEFISELISNDINYFDLKCSFDVVNHKSEKYIHNIFNFVKRKRERRKNTKITLNKNLPSFDKCSLAYVRWYKLIQQKLNHRTK